MTTIDIRAAIPGGILSTDRWHRHWHDMSCSRCRQEIPDDACPLMLWSADGQDMLIYCDDCTGQEAFAALAPIAPDLGDSDAG